MRKNKLLLLLALLLTAATGAWAETNLSQVMAAYTAQNGETLTGTLGANVKISIAACSCARSPFSEFFR